jgi:hypothetical protein
MALTRAWLLACVIITRGDVDDAQYRAYGQQPQFDAVAEIRHDSGTAGSGVLVAPRWVITAAHVAVRARTTPVHVHLRGDVYAVAEISIAPGYEDPAHQGLDRTPFDVALLRLDRVASLAPALLVDTAPPVGSVVTLVGYGVGGPSARDHAGIKRAAENILDQRGGMWRGRTFPPHVLFLDLDLAGRSFENELGGAEPRALEGVASGGDSGGGLFVHSAAGWRLAATFSASSVNIGRAAGGDYQGTINLHVAVTGHRRWIDSVTSAR